MPGLSDNMRAALFMLLSMAGFALNDAMMKGVAGELALFQAIFLRGLVATALLALLAARAGAFRHRPGRRDRRIVAVRSVAEIGATFCFLGALFQMPIADATAILQSVPLAVTLAAAAFLGEPVGWKRGLAVAIGFAGVLMIVRPGAEGFTGYALLAVASVGWIVLRDLSTRRLSPGMPSLAVSVWSSLAITVAAGLGALATEWRPVGAGSMGVLALAAASLLVGYVYGIRTMRIGEIAFVQPFRYSVLLWAILFGLLFFGEVPDGWMLAGSTVVIGTGLFTFYRERRLERSLAMRAHPATPGLPARGGRQG